jgi:hypothetical protein
MVIRKNNEEYDIYISHLERTALVNTIIYVVKHLGTELQTRTGFSVDEYNALLNSIHKNSSGNLSLSIQEIGMLHQAFNELVNGIVVPDIELNIGISIDKANSMCEELDQKIEQ